MRGQAENERRAILANQQAIMRALECLLRHSGAAGSGHFAGELAYHVGTTEALFGTTTT